jgi:uncharacterized membrane protein YphA (DoxX/SURF4 family)
MINNNSFAIWSLRVGLAFVFFYASYEIFMAPERFLKYCPDFLIKMIPGELFLPLFGVSEVVLAAWLMIGWKGHYPSLLSALMMVAIVAFNMDHFQILFRNVAIGFGSLSLVVLEWARQKEESKKQESYSKQVRA